MGVPIWGLPGDFKPSPPDDVQLASAETWHLPRSIWRDIRNKATGRGVKVAVLDTGVASHSILPSPIQTRSFIQGQGIEDGNGHGTHCSGTVLGRDEDIGVAPDAELIIGKVLSNQGSGGSDGIATGVKWAVEKGADVISMSLGGGDAYEPTRKNIQFALDNGCVVVCAAGNSGYNGSDTIGYPGKFLESICVGATRRDGQIANFSSGGRRIDVATPGENILSCGLSNNFATMSGTSMATPFMAGLFAIIIELMRGQGDASWSGVDAIRKFLEQWSEDRGNPGHDVRFGYGVPRAADIVKSLAEDSVKWL